MVSDGTQDELRRLQRKLEECVVSLFGPGLALWLHCADNRLRRANEALMTCVRRLGLTAREMSQLLRNAEANELDEFDALLKEKWDAVAEADRDADRAAAFQEAPVLAVKVQRATQAIEAEREREERRLEAALEREEQREERLREAHREERRRLEAALYRHRFAAARGGGCVRSNQFSAWANVSNPPVSCCHAEASRWAVARQSPSSLSGSACYQQHALRLFAAALRRPGD